VSLKRSDGSIRLTISDNSRDAEASDMVSEPTTLSFRLAKSLSVQLKGHLFWESDNGARFILSIPEKIIDPASVSEKRAAA
jgi:two-component sensor histidine kinase